MSTVPKTKTNLKGGQFIIKDSSPEDVFVPEEFNEEQLMVKEMVQDFLKTEIYPNIEKIEHQEDEIAFKILKKAADLGLLGTHMPMDFGGMEMDTNTNSLILDTIGPGGSFNTTFAAHTGIGMLPILYFGTDAQKEKYLPKLIEGTWAASYCLTEPNAGSDALSSKTTAVLSDDGKNYILNGQKMWISNAGFAHVFIVFAKIDAEKFTCFIVERGAEGMTFGAEEKKMGIKGSSTRQVFFENTPVPVENVLGTIGRGHEIAFNVLNMGRFKLSVMAIGGAKESANRAIKYANERHQFKVPISSFGAIKHKIAEQAIRLFACDSANYRVSDLIQTKVAEYKEAGMSYADAKLKGAEEYAVECAILKVAGSEIASFVIDETLQIHGGIGFSEEGDSARAYRDIRIARIYEGTNEINRLLTVDMLLKRAMKGRIDLVGPAWAVQKELTSMPSFDQPEGKFGNETKAVADMKKACLLVAGAAAKMQMDRQLNLKHEQEILMNIADILTDVFLAESALLRVQKLETLGSKTPSDVLENIVKVFINDAVARTQKNASDAICSFAEGDLLKTLLLGLKRFTKYPPLNVKSARRVIADYLIKEDGFVL